MTQVPRMTALPASLLGILMAACLPTPEPNPIPRIEIPLTWTAEAKTQEAFSKIPEQTEASGPELGLDTWWTSFGDPELPALIEEAWAGNQDLRAAAARLQQAAARAEVTGAGRAPQVSAGLDGARRKQNFIGFPIPGSQPGEVLSSTSTTFGVGLNVSWEADLWGRLRAGERAAEADFAAARAELEAARLSLSGQTVKAWFALTEAELQVALAEEILDSRQRSARQVRRRYEAGVRPALELRLSLSNEASAEAALAGRRQRLDTARRRLEVILGRYPAGTREAAATLPELRGAVPAGLPSQLLARRPDLAAAEARLAAAGARVDQARRALYPSLRLTGSTGTASSELKNLLDGDFSVWSFAGGLLQPLFQGGRLRASVDLAEGSQEEALAMYSQRLLNALGEVETGLAAEALLAEQRRALETAAEQAGAAQKLAEERYSGGLQDYLSVLESQRQASAAQSQLLEVRQQQLSLRVDLFLALGGGVETTSLDTVQTNVRINS